MVACRFPESGRVLRGAAIAVAGLAALRAELNTDFSCKDRGSDPLR